MSRFPPKMVGHNRNLLVDEMTLITSRSPRSPEKTIPKCRCVPIILYNPPYLDISLQTTQFFAIYSSWFSTKDGGTHLCKLYVRLM